MIRRRIQAAVDTCSFAVLGGRSPAQAGARFTVKTESDTGGDGRRVPLSHPLRVE